MGDTGGLQIAYYCTGHGLGHATRTIEIVRHLLASGHTVTVVTGAPSSVFLQALGTERFSVRGVVLDVGAKQLDAFTVDMKGSLEAYHSVAVANRETLLANEETWLRAWGAHLVVSDVVPLACAAAYAAGLRCVCVSNFSWDFIYSEYLSSVGSSFRTMVWQVAEDYAKADLLLRLPGYSPMPAFREVRDTALVVRRARKDRTQVRKELGLSEDVHMVLFMFGGQPTGLDWRLREESLPPGWVCVVCSGGKLPNGQPLPPNYILADQDVYTPDLVGAADCVLGKIGYGSTSECLAHGTPLIFVRRDYFNEEPFLRKLLQRHELAIEMTRRDFLAGTWGPFLARSLDCRKDCGLEDAGAAEVAAALVSEARSPVGAHSGVMRNGSTRLRDAIVWGYMMQRHDEQKKVEVPDWYMTDLVAGPQKVLSPRPMVQPLGIASDIEFEVLHGVGSLTACPDTAEFLNVLRQIDDIAGLSDSESPRMDLPSAESLPEYRAARSLFRWEDDIYVTRAPGRLDVMGGIADYSGSLVLQLPIAEACHVACQRQPTSKQRLWRHILARQAGKGGPQPALRIVSFQADSTNRGPAFDMDMADFLKDGEPISYEEARRYFAHDPPVRWAAYAAGCLLVLMREKGVRFTDGISILISSAVPEGKGVSSSAAVEVAVMQALLASHGIPLAGHELATLCQKVENRVVGAPCGIMDQMAVALGDKGSLLALTCQPAELGPRVHLPFHTRFWGIDSGIRHSVGGTDYGTVRAGAFMGLRMLTARAQASADEPPTGNTQGRTWAPISAVRGRCSPDGCPPSAIGGGYLANIRPSEFAQLYEELLPESITGADFLAGFGEHWDTATQVEPSTVYPVRAPASHPILENFRVEMFRQLLQPGNSGASQMEALGELMYQSHSSYSRCGLGSEGTDRIVALVRAEAAAARADGREPALWGAKITGGGSGGTVCVMGSADGRGEEALQRVIEKYSEQTGGYQPYIFSGSSPGATAFGHLRIRRRGGNTV